MRPRFLGFPAAAAVAFASVGGIAVAAHQMTDDRSLGVLVLFALAAAVSCLATAFREADGRRAPWIAVAIGCSFWAFGRPDAYGAEQSSSTGGNLSYIILVVAIAYGGLSLTRESLDRDIRVRLMLDLMPAVIALGIASWVFVVGPYVFDGAKSGQLQISALLHGIGFLVMLTLGLAGVVSEKRRTVGRAAWLYLTGIAVMALGDAIWLQRLTGGLSAITGAADAAFGACFVLIGAAALMQLTGWFAIAPLGDAAFDARTALHDLLPFLALGALLLIAGAQAAFGESLVAGTVTTIAGALAVLIFVAARQAIDRRQQTHLRREIGKLSYQIDGLVSQVGRDPLTGLLNHRAVHERLDHELNLGRANGYPVAVALIDVDNFKTVNDTLGHQAGDRVLRAVASILESACRTTDIAARYAGDEFMLLLPGLDEAHAGQVCGRIAREVQRINDDLDLGQETRITLSIGVAVTHRCNRTTPHTVAIADAAMYDAKEGGKNRVVVVNADTLVIAGPVTHEGSIVEAMAESREAFPWVIEERRQAG